MNDAKIDKAFEDIKNIKIDIENMKNDLCRLICVFNERLTDLYSQMQHINMHGTGDPVPRQNTILIDYFSKG